jgi:nitric oxide reductase NorD protein
MSGLLSLLEPEEFIGSHWHRLTRGRASLPHHAAAAVSFDEVAGALPVFFRGLGGDVSVRFAMAAEVTSRHRLSRRLSLMLGEEKLSLARRDESAVLLPPTIAIFDTRQLNRRLFFWLAAFFVHMAPAALDDDDPLARDLDFLRRAKDATARVVAHVPGLANTWNAIASALCAARPERPLKEQEFAVEEAILKLLDDNAGDGGPYWPVICGDAQPPAKAARGYRTFLPVLAWGEAIFTQTAANCGPQGDEEAGPSASPAGDAKTRKARRADSPETERKDYLALNRFEKMLSLIESMTINRAGEDDDEEGAKKALDDAEELRLSSHSRKASTRLKADLDIAATLAEVSPVAEADYPEWDWRQKRLVPNVVRVVSRVSQDEADPPDNAARAAAVAQVRRRFEAFRPRAEVLRAQADGSELDMEAVVRARVELLSTGQGSDRIYVQTRRRVRDLSIAVLADASLSTDSWLDGRRVLDVEQEALVMLSHALTACGDEHAIFAFTSRKRRDVRVSTLKSYDEPLSERVERRIFGLKPGYYTRLGAAIRHVSKGLVERPHEHRLLIVLTDGKPNDIDHYEGRFGVEDTRHAVQEARRAGASVFGITVDAKAQDYFPTLFGRGGYAIVQDPAQLPQACLSIYRTLVRC